VKDSRFWILIFLQTRQSKPQSKKDLYQSILRFSLNGSRGSRVRVDKLFKWKTINMADDFHEQLRIGADGLYAETLRGSKRFICHSKVTADGDWYLSCTDVKDNFWEKTFTADEVAKLVSNRIFSQLQLEMITDVTRRGNQLDFKTRHGASTFVISTTPFQRTT
jgi:hypothetical protein